MNPPMGASGCWLWLLLLLLWLVVVLVGGVKRVVDGDVRSKRTVVG